MGDKNKFYINHRIDPNERISLNKTPSCDIDLSKSEVNFIVFMDHKGKITVSYHYKDETEYKNCASIDVPADSFQQFFVSMYAKTSKSTKARFDISTMTLSTDTENIGVSEFEAKFDENMPKLFKNISFFKNNQATINNWTNDFKKDKFNLPEMHFFQSMIYNSIDYSNAQLSRSLEETDTIRAYIDNQNFATNELGTMIIESLDNWLSITEKQYQTMDKDINSLIKDIESFNFQDLYKTTDDLLINLNSKLKKTNKEFKAFKSFSRLIGKNLNILDQKKSDLVNLPKVLKKVLKKKGKEGPVFDQTLLVALLLFLGIFIVVALLVILYKIGKTQKRIILG